MSKESISTKTLCRLSGLHPADIRQLEAARLLLPDYSGRFYRPKNLSWAKKLAYLLQNGWKIQSIRAWADGRWSTPNPREWPPRKSEWQS